MKVEELEAGMDREVVRRAGIGRPESERGAEVGRHWKRFDPCSRSIRGQSRSWMNTPARLISRYL
jgi:hypothetical protein